MIRYLGELTGFSSAGLNRVRRIFTLGIIAFTVLLTTALLMGYFLQQGISAMYVENYMTLEAAGLTDLVTAPEVINQQLMLLVVLFPLIGATAVFPLFLWVAYEINRLVADQATL